MHWKNLAYWTSLILLATGCKNSPKEADSQSKAAAATTAYEIAFYNVENLFDTIDDPMKEDEWFLPTGDAQWTAHRYQKKLENLSSVIKALVPKNQPLLMGLCEVENESVVKDLIASTFVQPNEYDFVCTKSPDERGIDVALLYSKDGFRIIDSESISIQFPFDSLDKTRDILYVKGILSNADTLHLYVNHWPSRSGGKEKSEPKRMYVASVLKNHIDKFFDPKSNSRIVLLGDFNDYPDDQSLTASLGAAKQDSGKATALINLMADLHSKGEGSYNYKGNWGMLDQIIVSATLLDTKATSTIMPESAGVFKQEWMLYLDTTYNEEKPFRTYKWKNYLGGYSDHLPVHVTLEVK